VIVNLYQPNQPYTIVLAAAKEMFPAVNAVFLSSVLQAAGVPSRGLLAYHNHKMPYVGIPAVAAIITSCILTLKTCPQSSLIPSHPIR